MCVRRATRVFVLWSCLIECVISGVLRGVNEIFALEGYYSAYIGNYRRFRTTYRPILKGQESYIACPLKMSDMQSWNLGNWMPTCAAQKHRRVRYLRLNFGGGSALKFLENYFIVHCPTTLSMQHRWIMNRKWCEWKRYFFNLKCYLFVCSELLRMTMKYVY